MVDRDYATQRVVYVCDSLSTDAFDLLSGHRLWHHAGPIEVVERQHANDRWFGFEKYAGPQTTLWYDDNFVGTELDPHLSYAKVAKACGLEGVQVKTQAELTAALKEACAAQGKGVTTFIEVVLNQELGEPFRRDAMKKPVVVAGIDRKDMRPQQGAV